MQQAADPDGDAARSRWPSTSPTTSCSLLGQPLHAFDLDTLSRLGRHPSRPARGRSSRTLDDVERALDPEDLLIVDGDDTPLAIAGVMGGATSEVSRTTTDVLIEAAHFDPVTVARSSRRHRLTTEASKRFERGVDPASPPAAAQLAVDLLVEHGGGTADQGVTDVDDRDAARRVRLRHRRCRPATSAWTTRASEVVATLRAEGCDGRRATAASDPSGDAPVVAPGPHRRPGAGRGGRPGPRLRPDPVGAARSPAAGRGLTHGQRVRRVVANDPRARRVSSRC